jgi:hypothetical protein
MQSPRAGKEEGYLKRLIQNDCHVDKDKPMYLWKHDDRTGGPGTALLAEDLKRMIHWDKFTVYFSLNTTRTEAEEDGDHCQIRIHYFESGTEDGKDEQVLGRYRALEYVGGPGTVDEVINRMTKSGVLDEKGRYAMYEIRTGRVDVLGKGRLVGSSTTELKIDRIPDGADKVTWLLVTLEVSNDGGKEYEMRNIPFFCGLHEGESFDDFGDRLAKYIRVPKGELQFELKLGDRGRWLGPEKTPFEEWDDLLKGAGIKNREDVNKLSEVTRRIRVRPLEATNPT